jgi:hypothetical protein
MPYAASPCSAPQSWAQAMWSAPIADRMTNIDAAMECKLKVGDMTAAEVRDCKRRCQRMEQVQSIIEVD